MRRFNVSEPAARSRPYREFLHSTFTIPSNFSGNYEGDLSMLQPLAISGKRRLSFRSESDEEYSDLRPFDETRNTIETLRNRLVLSELAPNTSNIILKNVIYQKLVQLMTIFIFMIALVLLCSLEQLNYFARFLFQRRDFLYEWRNVVLFIVMAAVAYFYFYCKAFC